MKHVGVPATPPWTEMAIGGPDSGIALQFKFDVLSDLGVGLLDSTPLTIPSSFRPA